MKRPIGIFDSGVGGLTVYRAIRAAFPGEDLIYFGDTARVPYGPKSPNTILDYSLQNARFLLQHNIKILVVACNTASAVALPQLQSLTHIPIVGVIEPGAMQAVQKTKSGRIGVIGTMGTVRSQAYGKAILNLAPNFEIFSTACPLFVSLAEEGFDRHPVANTIAQHYLSFFDDKNIDTLVLGCTHYPLLKDVIAEIMGPDVSLVDSAQAISDHLKTILDPTAGDSKQGTDEFFVSDNEEQFSQLAAKILGSELHHLKRVKLFESWFEE